MDLGVLLGPVASILTIVGVVGGGVGVFVVQTRRGSSDARSALLQEQNAAITFLDGENKRLHILMEGSEQRAKVAEQQAKTSGSEAESLRRLVSLDVVPPALLQAMEIQTNRILTWLKEERHGP
jgi:hypothetical protein